jgi:tripartite-type tricarboxylate transporter receptor subunit TctC
VLVAKNAMPARDSRELIAWLKANPGGASQATVGIASPPHLLRLLFQKETGSSFSFVTYRGAAPAMQDLLGGHIDLMFVSPDVSLPQVRAGNCRRQKSPSGGRCSRPQTSTRSEAALLSKRHSPGDVESDSVLKVG